MTRTDLDPTDLTPSDPRSLLPATIMTPRLRLRRPVLADASRIATFLGDVEVARGLARVPHPYREADAKAWLEQIAANGDAHFAIVHANGVIGVVSVEVVGAAATARGDVALGYWLAKPFWGRGFMTEAAGAVTRATRAAAPSTTIMVSCAADNRASRRVIEKLGFEATGETMCRLPARDADVRALTYRLPLAAARSVPALSPA